MGMHFPPIALTLPCMEMMVLTKRDEAENHFSPENCKETFTRFQDNWNDDLRSIKNSEYCNTYFVEARIHEYTCYILEFLAFGTMASDSISAYAKSRDVNEKGVQKRCRKRRKLLQEIDSLFKYSQTPGVAKFLLILFVGR